MEEIRRYFASLKLPEHSYERNVSGFERNPDIASELVRWLKTKEYPVDNAIEVEGYTARKIAQMAPILDGVGAYNFLITLREKPERAKKYITEGFKLK